MEITVRAEVKQKFLPTKRCRKERTRSTVEEFRVHIAEPEESGFPEAFTVRDYATVYENAETYRDFGKGDGDFRMYDEPIRTYGGRLFKPLRVTHGAAVSMKFEKAGAVAALIGELYPCAHENPEFSGESVITGTDRDEAAAEAQRKADGFVYYGGHFWEECGEPMYLINTFGLGHNHGGTGFFVKFFYNSNIPGKNYFTALQKKEAVAYFMETALGRGDTKSAEMFSEETEPSIAVHMPEMVKRNPAEEGGAGDPFMNGMEGIIRGSGSAFEAGLLCIMETSKEVAGGAA